VNRVSIYGVRGAFVVLLAAAACLAPSVAAAAEACPNAQFRTGPSETLPDCRAYEQVSPSAKSGYDAVSRVFFLQYPAEAAASSEDPEISYMGNGSFAGALGNLSPDAHLSVRSPYDWRPPPLPWRRTGAATLRVLRFPWGAFKGTKAMPLSRLVPRAPRPVPPRRGARFAFVVFGSTPMAIQERQVHE
jgi:hypothetical protein